MANAAGRSREALKAIRDWAESSGWAVSDRGRLPSESSRPTTLLISRQPPTGRRTSLRTTAARDVVPDRVASPGRCARSARVSPLDPITPRDCRVWAQDGRQRAMPLVHHGDSAETLACLGPIRALPS
ncbi:Lsr2 family DNA-binding protein [Actinomycetospora straminea]|uniref:Lsr2 family DNA-binding protein n=1 Tax=Actinomycetospora straminea TaxID=663607 RepID=UPI003B67F90F